MSDFDRSPGSGYRLAANPEPGPELPSPSPIYFDARWVGKHGIARFAGEVRKRLDWLVDAPTTLPLFHPLDPLRLGWLLWRKKPKVYYTPGFNPPLPNGGVPLVMTVHDLNYVDCRENSDLARRIYFETLVRAACRRSHSILTVSEYSRQRLLEWARLDSAKVINVGCGIDPIFAPQGSKFSPGFPYLLYVGGRGAHKNIPRMIAAFAAAKISADVRLLLSGSPDASIAELAQRHGVGERVSFLGQIEESDLPSFYRGALALVFPSLYEGFGLPPLEALACGTPALAGNVTSMPEILGDAALLVDPYSTDAIAAGMARLCEDGALRLDLGTRGIERAKRYTWDRTAELVARALRSAADTT